MGENWGRGVSRDEARFWNFDLACLLRSRDLGEQMAAHTDARQSDWHASVDPVLMHGLDSNGLGGTSERLFSTAHDVVLCAYYCGSRVLYERNRERSMDDPSVFGTRTSHRYAGYRSRRPMVFEPTQAQRRAIRSARREGSGCLVSYLPLW